MPSRPRPTVVAVDDFDRAVATMTPLPPEMQDRPDARELRAFILAFRSIRDPASRRRILEEIENAES